MLYSVGKVSFHTAPSSVLWIRLEATRNLAVTCYALLCPWDTVRFLRRGLDLVRRCLSRSNDLASDTKAVEQAFRTNTRPPRKPFCRLMLDENSANREANFTK